ncbi:hypothetical protein [Salinicoccus carnicancri]|uniref:hypothetical protein n=1 Tax=Salinicoccus carnicancri TaxID=558170 RepID=UPI0003086F59|nr:hypothetical protein [Salinicoccus carnicancri]
MEKVTSVEMAKVALDEKVEDLKEVKAEVNNVIEKVEQINDEHNKELETLTEQIEAVEANKADVTSMDALKELTKNQEELKQDLKLAEELSKTLKAKGIKQIEDVVTKVFEKHKEATKVFNETEQAVTKTVSISTVVEDSKYLKDHATTINQAFGYCNNILLDYKIVKQGEPRYKSYHLGKRGLYPHLKEIFDQQILRDHKVFI